MIFNIKLCLRHSGWISGRSNIKFQPGMNVVIGPNGSGKSSLLSAIYQCPDCLRNDIGTKQYRYFNSETMNPHRCEDQFKGVHGSLIRVRAMFSSHGETMRDVLRFLHFEKGDVLLLDEPETGHDFQWVLKIRQGLQKISQKGCQIIVASHHPLFFDAQNVIELKRGYKRRNLNNFRKQVCLK